MARAVEDNWPGELSGLVVTRYGYSVPCRHIEIIESAHPVPDAASVTAAQRILDKVKNLGAEDQVLCLILDGETTVTVRGKTAGAGANRNSCYPVNPESASPYPPE